MATATRTTTDAKTRSLELAAERGHGICSHAARQIGMLLDDSENLVSVAWRIASASSDTAYTVSYSAARDHAACECAAAQHGRPCWHAGLALLKGRYLARLYSPAGRAEAERDFYRDLAHESNARALGYRG